LLRGSLRAYGHGTLQPSWPAKKLPQLPPLVAQQSSPGSHWLSLKQPVRPLPADMSTHPRVPPCPHSTSHSPLPQLPQLAPGVEQGKTGMVVVVVVVPVPPPGHGI